MMMKATRLLEKQQRTINALFARVEKSKHADDKRDLFEQIAADLVAHHAIESEIFYPSCERKMNTTGLLADALVVHGMIEYSLFLANESMGSYDFDYRMCVLHKLFARRAKEEKKQIFPKIDASISSRFLDDLTLDMRARFEISRKADFRAPLRDKVLASMGVMRDLPPEHGVPLPKSVLPPPMKSPKNGTSTTVYRSAKSAP